MGTVFAAFPFLMAEPLTTGEMTRDFYERGDMYRSLAEFAANESGLGDISDVSRDGRIPDNRQVAYRMFLSDLEADGPVSLTRPLFAMKIVVQNLGGGNVRGVLYSPDQAPLPLSDSLDAAREAAAMSAGSAYTELGDGWYLFLDWADEA